MVLDDLSAAICLDLKATNATNTSLISLIDDTASAAEAAADPSAAVGAAPSPTPFLDFIKQLLAQLMAAFTGCAIPPIAATRLMNGRPGLRGIFDESNLINFVRSKVNGPQLQTALVIPVVQSLMRVGKTVTLAHTTAMMTESGVSAA